MGRGGDPKPTGRGAMSASYGSFQLDHGRDRAGSWEDEDPMDTSGHGGIGGLMRRLTGQEAAERTPVRTHSISKVHRGASGDAFRGAGLGGFDG